MLGLDLALIRPLPPVSHKRDVDLATVGALLGGVAPVASISLTPDLCAEGRDAILLQEGCQRFCIRARGPVVERDHRHAA